ncbi:ABC transporter substrate-binding protein [Zafaria sp. J156]|uniref:ABC transporter substrate-binding protein n=1 Tax=Zafaria sp. J156 TaxID=3116490 RepID=UPI002E767ABF|nr:ABC transporter substrate-binding protein [Zafaria sp. J156]MEE1621880.1 ABC transporter substrate-binding protein [Zafaria sp. J156]
MGTFTTAITRTTAATSLVAALALALTACGGPADAGGSAAAGSRDKHGGEIVYLDAELSRNTQLQSSGTWQDSAYIENIADRLVYRDPATQEIKPWLAQEWSVSDDGLSYVFTIRDGVSFSNGQALDAQAVKRNLEWQITGDEAKGIPANNWFPRIAGIAADDAAQTVTVQLEHPSTAFLAILSFWRSAIVADETIEAPIETQQQLSGIIGSGPFVVESEKYGEEIVLTRREGYAWAPQGLANQGEAYLEKVTIIPVTEDSVRLGSLRAGEADVIRYIQPSEEKTLTDAGFEVVARQGVGNANVWDLKQSAPFLDDVRVRQALQHGIDRQQIIDDLYTENWSAATSIITPGSVGYKDVSELFEYDAERSNALLDDAGWTERDADGYRTKDGEQLRILTYVDVYDSTAKPLFQLVQWQLKAIGVNLDIKETDYANYSSVYSDPNVGALRNGWPEADTTRLSIGYSSGGSNSFAFQEPDAELDALLAAQLTAPGVEEREEVIADIQERIVEQAYALPIINDTQVFGVASTVHELTFSSEARPHFYETWTERK